MKITTTTHRMKLPYKIEIEVEGRWVQIGEDNDKEAATESLSFIDTYIAEFADDLRACGWSGPKLGALRLRDDEAGADGPLGDHRQTGEDESSAMRELMEATKKATAFGKSAANALDAAAPVLSDILRNCWDTGQGTRVRQILWSLYNGSGLVALGYTCSGLDTEVAEALAAAIRARLALGADAEDAFKRILEDGGEFARFHAAAGQTPEPHAIVYPPLPVSAQSLRELADSLDATAKQ